MVEIPTLTSGLPLTTATPSSQAGVTAFNPAQAVGSALSGLLPKCGACDPAHGDPVLWCGPLGLTVCKIQAIKVGLVAGLGLAILVVLGAMLRGPGSKVAVEVAKTAAVAAK